MDNNNLEKENITETNEKQESNKFSEQIKQYLKVKKLINKLKRMTFYDTDAFKKYGKKEDAEDLYQKPKKTFDHIRMMKSLLVIIFIIALYKETNLRSSLMENSLNNNL